MNSEAAPWFSLACGKLVFSQAAMRGELCQHTVCEKWPAGSNTCIERATTQHSAYLPALLVHKALCGVKHLIGPLVKDRIREELAKFCKDGSQHLPHFWSLRVVGHGMQRTSSHTF